MTVQRVTYRDRPMHLRDDRRLTLTGTGRGISIRRLDDAGGSIAGPWITTLGGRL